MNTSITAYQLTILNALVSRASDDKFTRVTEFKKDNKEFLEDAAAQLSVDEIKVYDDTRGLRSVVLMKDGYDFLIISMPKPIEAQRTQQDDNSGDDDDNGPEVA